MTIILTGFEPFGKLGTNPSREIVQHLAAETHNFPLHTAILPTAYDDSAQQLNALMAQHQPDYVVALGVANGRKHINLERFALNINDASLPDNAGALREGTTIVADAPPAYMATLPLDALYAALQQANIPVRYSNHAGAYVCNHILYSTLHTIASAGLPTRAGFIHVPMNVEAEGEKGAEVGLPLAQMIDAIRLCLRTLAM